MFVDLYQVVRQSMRISHPSYSIKKVRTFFMAGAGQGAVTGGGDSILEFERWRAHRRSRHPRGHRALQRGGLRLDACRLRDWLLDRKREAERAAGVTIPWKSASRRGDSPESATEDDAAAIASVAERLAGARHADAPAPCGHLLDYHRREAKPEWWAYFDRQKKSLDDLLDDTEAIAYLSRWTASRRRR